jgi:threonine/homoserine/homoserine lactone efflux protein
MTLDMAVALIGFAFATSISPGPSNLLVLASGVNFGFARTLPLVLGVSAGFLAMVFLVATVLGPVLARVPELYTAMRLACGAYVAWLAVKIAGSRSIGSAEAAAAASPMGFLQGALLQLVNPKAWAVALIVTVSYTEPGRFLASLAILIGLFAAVNVPSIAVWALSGAALRRVLTRGRLIALFNIGLALLLIGSMIPVLLPSHLG